MGLFVDTTPLRRYPEFRRLWSGLAVSSIGSQLAVVAIAIEVFHITGSSLAVGAVSLAQLPTALLGSILGGAIADAIDRRKLLIITGTTNALIAAGLGINAGMPHPKLWLIYVLAAIAAGVQGCDGPARVATLISIVDREEMTAANALRQLVVQISSVLGPALGGVLIAVLGGVHWVFFINSASFLVAVGTVISISSHPPLGGGTRFGWTSIKEGFAFLKGRQALQGCFIADLNATILGMPTALFPELALVQFHGGTRTAGLLYAAPGFGALIASAFSGWTHSIRRPGLAVVLSIVIWGIALTGFGFSKQLGLALVLLGIAGGADVISAVFRSTIIQTEAPDRLRGRLSSIQQAVVTSGPRLGNFEAGFVAELSTAQVSVVTGGLGCLVGIAIIARLMPRFVHYELGRDEHETLAARRQAS